MDDNSEPEEGEAYYNKDDDDNINPDTAFSYIDEKIENVLGHFQKDFEGGVSAENLGAKFGGYGSFLPTYERSPSRLSRPKTPQRNFSTPRSPNSLSMEDASQHLKAPPNAPPTGRPGNASCPSGKIAAKHDSHLSSAQVAEKSTMKDDSFDRAGIPSDQKTLKVRIKMRSDNKAQRNTAIYCGLGLDYSPSSSLGDSGEESGGTVTIYKETTSESPTRILQVMTSNHVPGGVLISPLHDSVLCLLRKEKERPRDGKSILSLKACQEHSSWLTDESILGNGKQLNEKNTKFLMGKSEKLMELKHRSCKNVDNGSTLLIERKSENEIAGGKEMLLNDLKQTALSNSVNVIDSMEASARECGVSAEANQNASRGRLFSSDSAKESSLESISGRSRTSGNKKKRDKQSGSVEKSWEPSVVNSHKNASVDLGGNVGSKCSQNSSPLKCREDSKSKVGQIATLCVQNKINASSKKEKKLFEGKKKVKGKKNTGQIADSMKEILRPDVGATPKDTTSSSQDFSSGKNKIHKLQKDINKIQDNHRNASETNFKPKNDLMELSMGHFQNRPKYSGPLDFETEQNGCLDKSKEIFSGRTVDNQLSGVNALGVVPHLNDTTLASQTAAPTATASVVIQENWVQCDRCHKWRLLPFDTRPEQLPEKWLCSMLNWLPRMNRCDISEEETTKALNALYQVPVAENQNKPQSHANETTTLVSSGHLQHLDQNDSGFNSQASSIRGKKKHGLKEVQKAVSSGTSQMSKTKKNQQQESLKSRSLNDMTQFPVESNLTKKSSFEQKEKHPVGGETKQAKMKNKREYGIYAFEGSKKTKTEVIYMTDKHHSSNLDPRRVSLNSSTGWPTQANGRSVQNFNECSNSGDVKHDMKEGSVISVKKLVDQTQASSDGGSLDMRICDKRAYVKKRKLDWQDSEKGNELYMKEDSSESGFRNEKKSRVSKIEGKQSQRNDVDGTSNGKSMHHLISGTEEVRSIDRNQQLSKHKKKSASLRTLDGLDSLRRDSGPGQLSMAVTSSSSKVSGSQKTRANFEEARGSPVESVSSSPMRTSYPEKLASTTGDGSGKDDVTNNGIPLSGRFRRCKDGDGTFELAPSDTEMKENVSGDFNLRSHKASTLGYRDRDTIRKISIKTKPSSSLGNGHFHHGHTHFAENGQHAVDCSHGEGRLNKKCHGSGLFSQKSDKGSTSQTEDGKSSAADRMKVYHSTDEQEDLCSRKGMRYQSDVDPKGHACLQETIADCKRNMPKSSKDEKNDVGRRNLSGQWSSDSRMETPSNIKHDEFDEKSAVSCSAMRNTAPEQNLIQAFSGQSGMPKSSLPCEVENQQETKVHRTVSEAQQGVISDGFPVNGSGNVEVSKAGKAGSKNGSAHNLGQHKPDLRVVRDLNARSPVRVNSSSQTATNALNDAKELRNYADRLKGSGFVFESNEIYFQAALKFLGVAALLETRNSESSRHGDMNQMQVYSTVTKLCEMCAQEYERRCEMAAAALAYKCMEVAYMRVVYCKHSTSSRDRNELQATLQMVPQGESPSSSASDVDNNLNNQLAVDKAPLAKGNASHVAGTHVIVARNRPSFARLLAFTQDVSFAMEASRKSQNAFAAANSSLEEARNTDCITSVKKVIDFSFQDVDGLVCLVEQAMEAISRSGLGGARD